MLRLSRETYGEGERDKDVQVITYNSHIYIYYNSNNGITEKNRLNQDRVALYSHSLVDLNALLVLKAGLGQVNRKHTCDTN